ncbi:MAG: bifunctional GTP diphosphokinase/guanosine-3',5'-bis pyrophosphate 3'-pyrophosphohydrolase [Wenzhouxiangellaceae bacterium]
MRPRTSDRRGQLREDKRRLNSLIEGYLPPQRVAMVMHACEISQDAHEGQFRKSGEPYITHPIAVATLLAQMRMDHECLAAALLHDTIEDTPLTHADIAGHFGLAVADLVEGVTKLDKMKFRTRQEATAESFRKLLLAMAKDIRVLLIKLSDRLHNMRTLGSMNPDSRRRISRETLEIYAPLAERLGMHEWRSQLESLGFANLYPNRYRVISRRVRAFTGNRRSIIRNIKQALYKKMSEEKIPCRISGRQKSAYSIYRKMLEKNVSFNDVTDVFAFRIITETRAQCYQALGAVHELFQPKPGRFKDYIALPKPNGYQSLHTVLNSNDGTPIEIQIRTNDMDIVAEKGHASHWQYKYAEAEQESKSRVRGWLNILIDGQRHTDDSTEFMEGIKADLFPNEIFIFTPKGRIIDLPRGATALDFAYAIHTDVGDHAVSATVDRQMVPLSYRLSSGETIKINTTGDANPRADWLSFVTTSKARAAIRHYLKSLEQEHSVAMGYRLLEKALAGLGSSLEAVSQRRMQRYLKRQQLVREEDLMSKLARGEMLAEAVAMNLLSVMQRRESKRTRHTTEALSVGGEEGTAVTYSQCCYPIPGDRIIGYLSVGKGVVVHRNTCPNVPLLRKNPERLLNVSWEQVLDQRLFQVALKVDVVNRPGVLASISSSIGKANTNIDQVTQHDTMKESATLLFILNVRDRDHLARVIRRLRINGDVIRVNRDYT